MQQRPQPPELDIDRLPESVRNAIASAQREVVAAARTKQGEPDPSVRPGTSVPARLDDRTLLQVAAIRGHQLQQAFMRGREGAYGAGPRAGTGLWAGLAIAIAVALAIGLVALIQATIVHQAK
jgi:hypothetical protein